MYYTFYKKKWNQDSYRIVPKANEKTVSKSVADTLNKEYGVHDTFRYGPRRLVDEVLPAHPLQARLENVNIYYEFDHMIIILWSI